MANSLTILWLTEGDLCFLGSGTESVVDGFIADAVAIDAVKLPERSLGVCDRRLRS